ncbi:MAG: formylglycine-generating enzyme family protein, partial [bacterium]
MVLVPPGTYFRGDPDSAVLITLTQPLWVGKYEVTQHQYAVLTGTNPSHFRRPPPDMASHPVESVSHREATDCCAVAARNTGGGFRLLTEAEWEYAYRAGTRTKFYNGDADDRVGEIARYGADHAPAPARIGGKAPNAFGLHDMAGNVWEWVSDLWTKSYEPTQTVDPTGPPTGQGRVTRGSSWDASSNDCRAAHRSRDAETYAGSHLGFRLARAASGPPHPLDCTGPEGADPEAVAAAQRRWALHLGAAGPR